jgi:hypothetical protein
VAFVSKSDIVRRASARRLLRLYASASTDASCVPSRSSSDVINYVLSVLRNAAMAQMDGRREKS